MNVSGLSLHNPTRDLEDISADRNGFSSLSGERAIASLIFLVVFLLIMIVIGSIVAIREYLWASHRIRCCRPQTWRARQRRNREMNVPPNSVLVDGTSEETNLNERDRLRRLRILQKRVERRSWYDFYLLEKKKEYVHVVTENDLVKDKSNDTISITVPFGDSAKEFDDGCCTICMCEFQKGEKVVHSPLEVCPHLHHYECMMAWMTRGKKRCPVCRHWFVPGSRISEQVEAVFGDASERPTAITASVESSQSTYDGDDEESNIMTA